MIATSQISLVLLNRIFKQSNLIGNVFNDIIFDFYSLPQLSILFLKLLNLSCMLVLILYFYWSYLFFGKCLLLFTVWKRFLSEMLSLWHDISWNWGFWAWLILYWRLWPILMFCWSVTIQSMVFMNIFTQYLSLYEAWRFVLWFFLHFSNTYWRNRRNHEIIWSWLVLSRKNRLIHCFASSKFWFFCVRILN